jgi:hypothetical protein
MATDVLSLDQLQAAMPAGTRKNVTQGLVDNLNQMNMDPEFREHYRDNLVGFARVMQEGKFKVTSYLDAVRYVSFKLMGLNNGEAYARTFPDKIARFKAQGVAEKDVSSYVSAYHKSKLVGLILEQSMTPSWVLNQDMYQNALNKQAFLMMNAKSEKVQSDAAAHLMTALKPPESKKIQLELGAGQDETIAALRESTQALVAQQRQMLQSGMISAREAAHSTLVFEGEATEVN